MPLFRDTAVQEIEEELDLELLRDLQRMQGRWRMWPRQQFLPGMDPGRQSWDMMSDLLSMDVSLSGDFISPEEFAAFRTVYVGGHRIGRLPIELADDLLAIGYEEAAVVSLYERLIRYMMGQRFQDPVLKYESETIYRRLYDTLRRAGEGSDFAGDMDRWELAMNSLPFFVQFLESLPNDVLVVPIQAPVSMVFDEPNYWVGPPDGNSWEMRRYAVQVEHHDWTWEKRNPKPEHLAEGLFRRVEREIGKMRVPDRIPREHQPKKGGRFRRPWVYFVPYVMPIPLATSSNGWILRYTIYVPPSS